MRKKKLGGILPKLILIAVAVYALVSLIALKDRIQEAQQANAELEAQKQALAMANAELEDDLSRKDDPDKIAELARENFGLVEAGEVVFYDIGG